MPYDALISQLREAPTSLSVAAFPDGSVDTFYRVFDGDERIPDRAAFREALAAGRSELRLERHRRTIGGQSVNMAAQAHALGDDVALAGHLDDPAFGDLSFPTRSLGDPSAVSVLPFEDGDLLFAEESADIRSWGVEDLRAATADLDAFLDAKLVCSGNWGAYRGNAGVLDAVAAAGSGGTVVFDSGSLGGTNPERRRALLAGLGRLEPEYRTVLSAADAELDALAAALDGDDVVAGGADEDGNDRHRADRTADDCAAQCERIRAAAEISGVVAHAEGRAVAATPDGAIEVPNLDVPRGTTATGAGDRFTAGLGHGLAAGWEWEPALALGNVCASHFVARAETIGRADIDEFVRHHEPVQ